MSDERSYAEQLVASATGHFRWPEDAVLYHLPPERELLNDRARRYVFESYLQLAELPYTSRVAPNADYMSPSGMPSHNVCKSRPTVLYSGDDYTVMIVTFYRLKRTIVYFQGPLCNKTQANLKGFYDLQFLIQSAVEHKNLVCLS